MNDQVFMAVLGFLAAFIFREAWNFIAKKKDIESQKINSIVEKNTDAIVALQLAIVELKVKIEIFSEKLTSIPKLTHDVAEAHSKIRELKTQIQGNGNGT